MSEKLNEKSKPESGMTEAEIEALISGSFLRNVPELMASGMTMEKAVEAAFERDFNMLLGLQIVAERKSCGGFRAFSGKDEAYAELIDRMSANVYSRINEGEK